jgi:Cu/Ag efflux pump CusA
MTVHADRFSRQTILFEIDIAGRALGSYVDEAKKKISRELKLPTGYSLLWSGQYENMIRVKERLKVILPITMFLIFVFLFWNLGFVIWNFMSCLLPYAERYSTCCKKTPLTMDINSAMVSRE